MTGVLLDALGMPIYEPEAPNEIRKLMVVAGLLSRPATMYVTSAHWARIAAEIRANHQADLKQPWNLPHRDNFKRMKIGKLTVINSGTEDQEVCNTANWFECPPDFRARVESMKTGRGGTKFYPDSPPE